MAMDLPVDVGPALAALARLQASVDSGLPPEAVGPSIWRDLLHAAPRTALATVWSAPCLSQVGALLPPLTLARLPLPPLTLQDGMAHACEFWWSPQSFLAIDAITDDGRETRLPLHGLLALRLDASVPRDPPLPTGAGVFLAAVLEDTPAVGFWWPVGDTLADVVLHLSGEFLQRFGTGVPFALGFWFHAGVAARAMGGVSRVEVDGVHGRAAVVCEPHELVTPPSTPGVQGRVQ